MDKTFKLLLLFLAISLVVFALVGCSKQVSKSTDNKSDGYQKITAAAVKSRLDNGEKLIIVDVRTKEEYDTGHIKNSILIPYDEIEAKAASLLTDKNASIIVYCRSGRRSEIAAKSLLKLGYTNVADMGAISDWKSGLDK